MSLTCQTIHGGAIRTLVIAPNGSLTVGQAQWFFIYMCALSIVIASVLTLWGLWLIWPFSGLEMAVLGAGLYLSMRRSCYREVVSVSQDKIEIDAGRGHPERHWEFPRLLTQVQLRPEPARNSPSRLFVIRSGHGCEIGRCLTDEERQAVADRLQRLVRTPELAPEKNGGLS